MVGRTAAGRARLLAQACHHQIDADRQRRAGAGTERCSAPGVIRITGIAGPGAALVAQRRGQHLVGVVTPAGIASAAVIFGIDRLGEDDRSLPAELIDQNVIARRKIHVVSCIATARGTHVGGIERILEREHDAVHRHFLKIRIGAEFGIELRSTFQRIRLLAEEFASRRRAPRQRPLGWMKVELALARHRPLTADIEGADGIDLTSIGLADDHAELLLHARV